MDEKNDAKITNFVRISGNARLTPDSQSRTSGPYYQLREGELHKQIVANSFSFAMRCACDCFCQLTLQQAPRGVPAQDRSGHLR